ncbi:hypothetical protein [Stratiformator vulcanicus]|uniref:Uncharacterized protein n=1 Tax=Stratiformator vulcanicus TaxID=2527980 RepID=A0A517R323_9PLAN|nr:hypothetical protein [Stratiformator vulcanicus]QDT38286.1 hypothetical protein Pan189_26760 [Stratiformator vulcanicus]
MYPRRQPFSGFLPIAISLAIAIVGAAIGFGFLFQAAFASGEEVARYDVTPGEPLAFELTRGMSPVALELAVEVVLPSGQFATKYAIYDCAITADGSTVWAGQAGAIINEDMSQSRGLFDEPHRYWAKRVLPVLDVPVSDIYELTAIANGELDLEVTGFTLRIRRNVTRVNIPLVVSGFIAMTIGILGLVLFGVRAVFKATSAGS